MQRRGELGIAVIVLVTLAIIVLVILSSNLVVSGEHLRYEITDCEQNAGVCKNACASTNGRALPYACGEEEKTCCLLAAERGTPFIIY